MIEISFDMPSKLDIEGHLQGPELGEWESPLACKKTPQNIQKEDLISRELEAKDERRSPVR